MAEGRFISRSIAHSYDLAGVSLQAAFLFTWCIPHLDRDGRMVGDPILVKSMACPLRPELDPDRIEGALAELADAGLVAWYHAGGKRVLEFPKFRRHQKGLRYEREAESKFPPPSDPESRHIRTPAKVRSNSGEGPEASRNVADEVRGDRGPSPAEVKGSEEKLSQGKAAARARELGLRGWDKLAQLLGPAAAALDDAEISIEGSLTWPSAIVGMYGSSGTRRETLRGLDPGDIGEVLTEAVVAFAGERRDWHQPFFDSIVARVARDRREGGPVVDGMSEADRRVLRNRREMESWDLGQGAVT